MVLLHMVFDTDLIVEFVVWAIILFSVLTGLRYSRDVSAVKEGSKAYKSLLAINEKHSRLFSRYQDSLVLSFDLSSKRQFDSFDPMLVFQGLTDVQKKTIEEGIWCSRSNAIKFRAYQLEVDRMLPGFSFQDERRLRIEKKLLNSNKLAVPQIDFQCVVTWQYTSPAGRNQYSNSRVFPLAEMKRISLQTIAEAEKVSKTKAAQVKLERAKMSDSLRYEILKRDGFRCVLCGATAKDGVKLHVDHIYPVSKGGRTERSNLRTLCERCNLGKGAKLE